MKPPIYEPAGKAKEYGDLAINIYTGCTHGCYYCFAPNVLHKTKEAFSDNVMPRAGIVEEVKKQLNKEKITGKLIHLCFTCDPYPNGIDTSVTREIIKLIKQSGNHVQILTKSGCTRDLDLLDKNDWFGISLTGANQEQEPNADCEEVRLVALAYARNRGIKTWVSFEPVVNGGLVLEYLVAYRKLFDLVKIGKLNYHPSIINWKNFGLLVEETCKEYGINYYIKDGLRKEMERDEP